MPDFQDEDEIGYGKPPKSCRFVKGKSGNPLGRPKGSKNLSTLILQEAAKTVYVNGPKGKRKVTKLEATMMQMANKSAQGDLRAANALLSLVAQAELACKSLNIREDVSESDRLVMLELKQRFLRLDRNTNNGEEEDC